MKAIDKINQERLEFIKRKGYAPDTIYFGLNARDYNGCDLFGMEIKTSQHLTDSDCIMCRQLDIGYYNELKG